MKRNLITLAAATAIGLVMSASAHAGSNNTLYIDQSGNYNEADVKQFGSVASPSAGDNDIGKSGPGGAALQFGNYNYFNYSNADSTLSGSDNDIWALKQTGNYNWFRARDGGNSVGNDIKNVLQEGNTNQALIGRSAESGSSVDSVVMKGNSNVIVINQGLFGTNGGSNTVESATIIGSGNGNVNTNAEFRGAYAGYAGIRVVQRGTGGAPGVGNMIHEVSIEGNDNRNYPGIYGGDVVSVLQYGSNNGNNDSIARMKGSDGNFIHITQNGDHNQFDMQQGLDVDLSTKNQMTLLQSGSGNTAVGTQSFSFNVMDVTQIGDGNGVEVNQVGSTNFASVLMDGNNNGIPQSLAGGVAELPGLVSGVITQAGNGNDVSLTIDGDNNAFGFQQTGSDNDINGSQIGYGNKAGVSQSGSLNVASFVQSGSFNVVGVSQ